MLNFKIVNSICIGLLVVLVAASVFYSLPIYVFILLFLVWFGLTILGSFQISLNYFLTAQHSNSLVKTKSVAITFDDGIHPEFTPKILDLLKKHNTKATFFCIGKHLEQHPKIAQQIILQGHLIGNHSYSHKNNFGFLNTQQIIDEITKTDEIIYKTTGRNPLLFRPPFGVTNPNIAKAISQTQHKVIGWNVRSLDTVINNEKTILTRITRKLKKGSVILLHDTSQKTVNVLEQLLLFLKNEKYTSIRIDELLNIKAYE